MVSTDPEAMASLSVVRSGLRCDQPVTLLELRQGCQRGLSLEGLLLSVLTAGSTEDVFHSVFLCAQIVG